MAKYPSFGKWLSENKTDLARIISEERQFLELTNPTNPPRVVAAQNAGGDGSFMPVDIAKVDVSVKQDYESGFENMIDVVSNLLASEHKVRGIESDEDGVEGEVPWSQLYQLNKRKSTPRRGYIELTYMPVAGAGALGKMAWSASYMVRHPLRTMSQKVGLSRSPEHSYLNQFVADLRSYAAKGRVPGMDEWDFTTSKIGRDIIIRPKNR